MGIDAWLKRYFPGVICLLIALAAYYQASGIGQLVAASVATEPATAEGARTARSSRASLHGAEANPDHTTSAGSILSRNPFDSVTGPLDGKPLPTLAPPPPENKDPYQDPDCDGTRVVLITQAEDPAWSFAAIAGSDGKTILRREGDEVNGKTVYYVGWDRVWMTSSGARCQAVVGGKGSSSGTRSPVAAFSASPSSSAAPSKSSTSTTVPPEIASKIRKVSENEYNVDRSALDTILEKQADLMKTVRISPEKGGVRLSRVRKGSLLELIGLQTGDKLKSINGFDISDPSKALEAYARLTTADNITLNYERGGKDSNLQVHMK